MTELQRRFAAAYLTISPPNATAAYVEAGGKARGHSAEVQASRLMRNGEVLAAIAAGRAASAKRTNLTADWVLTKLVENVERAMQAVPVTDREGVETGEYQYAGQVANAALHLLGKHLGMFADRLEVQTTARLALEWVVRRADDRPAGGTPPRPA